MGKIDWNEMLDNFVKIENGVPKVLRVANWRKQESFKDEKTGEIKPGIVFDVLLEDGKEVAKTWTVTAVKALLKLRPILEKAEEQNHTEVDLNVIRAGEGRNTVYEIKAL